MDPYSFSWGCGSLRLSRGSSWHPQCVWVPSASCLLWLFLPGAYGPHSSASISTLVLSPPECCPQEQGLGCHTGKMQNLQAAKAAWPFTLRQHLRWGFPSASASHTSKAWIPSKSCPFLMMLSKLDIVEQLSAYPGHISFHNRSGFLKLTKGDASPKQQSAAVLKTALLCPMAHKQQLWSCSTVGRCCHCLERYGPIF